MITPCQCEGYCCHGGECGYDGGCYGPTLCGNATAIALYEKQRDAEADKRSRARLAAVLRDLLPSLAPEKALKVAYAMLDESRGHSRCSGTAERFGLDKSMVGLAWQKFEHPDLRNG